MAGLQATLDNLASLPAQAIEALWGGDIGAMGTLAAKIGELENDIDVLWTLIDLLL